MKKNLRRISIFVLLLCISLFSFGKSSSVLKTTSGDSEVNYTIFVKAENNEKEVVKQVGFDETKIYEKKVAYSDTSFNFSNYIEVFETEGLKKVNNWYVSTDRLCSDDVENKIATNLAIGDNLFYISVKTDSSFSALFIMNIYRFDIIHMNIDSVSYIDNKNNTNGTKEFDKLNGVFDTTYTIEVPLTQQKINLLDVFSIKDSGNNSLDKWYVSRSENAEDFINRNHLYLDVGNNTYYVYFKIEKEYIDKDGQTQFMLREYRPIAKIVVHRLEAEVSFKFIDGQEKTQKITGPGDVVQTVIPYSQTSYDFVSDFKIKGYSDFLIFNEREEEIKKEDFSSVQCIDYYNHFYIFLKLAETNEVVPDGDPFTYIEVCDFQIYRREVIHIQVREYNSKKISENSINYITDDKYEAVFYAENKNEIINFKDYFSIFTPSNTKYANSTSWGVSSDENYSNALDIEKVNLKVGDNVFYIVLLEKEGTYRTLVKFTINRREKLLVSRKITNSFGETSGFSAGIEVDGFDDELTFKIANSSKLFDFKDNFKLLSSGELAISLNENLKEPKDTIDLNADGYMIYVDQPNYFYVYIVHEKYFERVCKLLVYRREIVKFYVKEYMNDYFSENPINADERTINLKLENKFEKINFSEYFKVDGTYFFGVDWVVSKNSNASELLKNKTGELAVGDNVFYLFYLETDGDYLPLFSVIVNRREKISVSKINEGIIYETTKVDGFSDEVTFKIPNDQNTFNFYNNFSIWNLPMNNYENWKIFPNNDKDNDVADKIATDLKIGNNKFYIYINHIDASSYLETVCVINVYRRNMFDITFDSKGGSSVEPISVEEDSLLVEDDMPKPTRDGYEFAGWDYDYEKPVTNSLVLTAIWAEKSYTYKLNNINFHTYNCNGKVIFNNYYDDGKAFYSTNPVYIPYPTVPTKQNKLFAGWYSDVNCTEYFNGFYKQYFEDIELYSKWYDVSREEFNNKIEYNVSKPVNLTSNNKYFPFVPLVSGKITVSTTGNADTFGYLCDENKNILVGNDNSGSNNNFKFSYNVVAGKLYYIAVKLSTTTSIKNADLLLSGNNEPFEFEKNNFILYTYLESRYYYSDYASITKTIEFGEEYNLEALKSLCENYNVKYEFRACTNEQQIVEVPLEGKWKFPYNIELFILECTPKRYTITYNNIEPNDYFPNEIKSYTIDDLILKFPTPTRSNYIFEGWYLDSEFTMKIEELINCNYKNISLFAKWTERSGSKLYEYTDRTGSLIKFGSYPQSLVSDKSIINRLENLTGYLGTPKIKTPGYWSYYSYYNKGSNNVNYMWYIDVTDTNGDKYRGVYFNAYRPTNLTFSAFADYTGIGQYSNQYKNGYKTGKIYWFKYELLLWRVIKTNSNKATLLCESIIDSQEFDNNICVREKGDNELYSYDYEYSSIRQWLNYNFYNTAFNELERNIICLSNVDGLNDKVYLLSKTEFESLGVTQFIYKTSSDYAKCQGSYVSNDPIFNQNGWWLTRSTFTNSTNNDYLVYSVFSDGCISISNMNYSNRGVVPVIQITL